RRSGGRRTAGRNPRDGRLQNLFVAGLLGGGLVPGGKNGGGRFRPFLLAPPFHIFLVQRPPFVDAVDQPTAFGGRAAIDFCCVRARRARLWSWAHGWKARLGFAARLHQVLLGVVHFVLVQLQLRFGLLELAVDGVLLGSRSFGLRGGELRNQRLIGG